MRGSDDAMSNNFMEYIKVNGNKEVAETVLGLMFQGDVPTATPRLTEIKITDGTGEIETIDLDEPYVRTQKERIEKITDVQTLEQQIEVQKKMLEANPNKKQSQIMLQLLLDRQEFLLSQSASLDMPIGEGDNATVLNQWIV